MGTLLVRQDGGSPAVIAVDCIAAVFVADDGKTALLDNQGEVLKIEDDFDGVATAFMALKGGTTTKEAATAFIKAFRGT